jgi:hypothetical protein
MHILIGIWANINMDVVILGTNLEANPTGCFTSIMKVAVQKGPSFPRLLHAMICTAKSQIADENMPPEQILFL